LINWFIEDNKDMMIRNNEIIKFNAFKCGENGFINQRNSKSYSAVENIDNQDRSN
jgi:hypothetical protein